jgi:hypothetical protein
MGGRPVILVVDDDPDVLARLLDALARRYGSDYRVRAGSMKRVASAVREGAVVVESVHEFLAAPEGMGWASAGRAPVIGSGG